MRITLEATYKPCLDKNGEPYPDYYVSEHGDVLSTKKAEPRVLNGSTASNSKDETRKGMYRLAIMFFGTKKDRFQEYFHTLVARSWIGMEPFENATVNHKDLNKKHNHFSNLEWVTYSENQLHAYEMGASKRGQDRSDAVLTDDAVRTIRKFRQEGKSVRCIGKLIGVHESTVKNVVQGRTWRHVA
jgi:HNH endonuclease